MLTDRARAIVAAANRGVETTILFSRNANIGDDINWRALHGICRRAAVRIADSHPVEAPAGLKKYNRLLASLQQLHQWLT